MNFSPGQVKRFYTFLSHAGRALALWRGRFPAEVIFRERNQPAG